MKFKSDTFGAVTGVRFYKAAATPARTSAACGRPTAPRLAHGHVHRARPPRAGSRRCSPRRSRSRRTRPTWCPTSRPTATTPSPACFFYKPSPLRRRRGARRPAAARACRDAATSANGFFGYGSGEHVPDRQLPRRELLRRRPLRDRRRPRARPGARPPPRARLGQRDVDGADHRRLADAATRSRRTSARPRRRATTVTGTPPPDERDGHRPHAGHVLHLQGDGDQRARAQRRVGASNAVTPTRALTARRAARA